jgi:hypothetical protein
MDQRLKKTLLIAFSAGAGIAVALAALAGGAYWYLSKPKPQTPWNTTAIVASGPPSFGLTDDSKKVEFTYALENTTSSDYRIDSATGLSLVAKGDNDTLTRPMPSEIVSMVLPVFIPAKQKAVFSIDINFANVPQRKQSDATPKLRAFHDGSC